MNEFNEIVVLNEEMVSNVVSQEPKVREDDGLTEMIIKKIANPRLSGADEIEITESPFVIGKDPNCDFCIDNKYISRKHCRIVRRQDGYYIEDLRSTNGTFIDGKQTEGKVKLEKGQEVKLADREYIWEE